MSRSSHAELTHARERADERAQGLMEKLQEVADTKRLAIADLTSQNTHLKETEEHLHDCFESECAELTTMREHNSENYNNFESNLEITDACAKENAELRAELAVAHARLGIPADNPTQEQLLKTSLSLSKALQSELRTAIVAAESGASKAKRPETRQSLLAKAEQREPQQPVTATAAKASSQHAAAQMMASMSMMAQPVQPVDLPASPPPKAEVVAAAFSLNPLPAAASDGGTGNIVKQED